MPGFVNLHKFTNPIQVKMLNHRLLTLQVHLICDDGQVRVSILDLTDFNVAKAEAAEA